MTGTPPAREPLAVQPTGRSARRDEGWDRAADNAAELYITFAGDLNASHLAEALLAFSELYLLLAYPNLDPLQRRTIPADQHLGVRDISTSRSVTVMLTGSATMASGIAAAPLLAGSAVAAAVAWILRYRKIYHEGTKAKYEAAKLKSDARMAEIAVRRALLEQAESLMSDRSPELPTREIADTYAMHLFVALDLDPGIRTARLNGEDLLGPTSEFNP